MTCLKEDGNDCEVLCEEPLFKKPVILKLPQKTICVDLNEYTIIESFWETLQHRNRKHVLGLSKNGEVFILKRNDKKGIMIKIDFCEKIIKISAGDSHSACLSEDGRVFAWGSFEVSSYFVLQNLGRLIN